MRHKNIRITWSIFYTPRDGRKLLKIPIGDPFLFRNVSSSVLGLTVNLKNESVVSAML